jgi:hypothetical protein
MGILIGKIRRAVEEDRFAVSEHADEQMRERRIVPWQVVSGISTAKLVAERPDAWPNPVVEVEQLLPDGAPITVIWAWLEAGGN